MRLVSRPHPSEHDERGVTLLLALVIMIGVSLSVLALVSFAGNSLLATASFRDQRSFEYAANSVTDVAVQNVRFLPITTAVSCLPFGVPPVTVDGYTFSVSCTGTTNPNPLSSNPVTRQVTFYTCQGMGPCTAANAAVQAVVSFEDISATGSLSCTQSSSQSCGTGEVVNQWLVTSAKN